MPIPTPKENEKRDTFISRCISMMERLDTKRPHDQIQAMCYNKWRDKGTVGQRGGDRGGQRKRPLKK